jgi:hypothetical protein
MLTVWHTRTSMLRPWPMRMEERLLTSVVIPYQPLRFAAEVLHQGTQVPAIPAFDEFTIPEP